MFVQEHWASRHTWTRPGSAAATPATLNALSMDIDIFMTERIAWNSDKRISEITVVTCESSKLSIHWRCIFYWEYKAFSIETKSASSYQASQGEGFNGLLFFITQVPGVMFCWPPCGSIVAAADQSNPRHISAPAKCIRCRVSADAASQEQEGIFLKVQPHHNWCPLSNVKSNLDALSARETPRLCWEYETDKLCGSRLPLNHPSYHGFSPHLLYKSADFR